MRVLVLGAAGMLGHKVYQTLVDSHIDVYAAFRKKFSDYESLGIFSRDRSLDQLDVCDTQNLFTILNELRPDCIVNCVGVTTRKVDSAGIKQLIQINALLPHQLVEWATAHRSRVIHFSTDCVFSGKQGPYHEDHLKDAVDPYGQTKALGEIADPCALTLRMSIIGFELGSSTELLGWLISQKGKPIRGFSHALYSGVTTNWLARTVSALIRDHKNLSGVFQIASAPISKCELLEKLNARLGLNCQITPDRSVVTDKRLDGSHFIRVTGIQVPTWDLMIEELDREYQLKLENMKSENLRRAVA